MNPFAAPRHKPGMGAISENATRPGRRRLKAAGLAIGLLLMAGFVLVAPILWLAWLDPFGGSPHPSDAQLTAQLAIHRGELEQLVAMAREDERLQRLAPDFMRPENAADAGVDARRIEEYRASGTRRRRPRHPERRQRGLVPGLDARALDRRQRQGICVLRAA